MNKMGDYLQLWRTEIKFEKGEKYGMIEEWERNLYGTILKRRSTQATMGTITW